MTNFVNYLSIISKSKLFEGIDTKGISALAPCLKTQIKEYRKGDILLMAGFPVDRIGVILSGSIEGVREDSDGRRIIISRMGEAEMFGEVLACSVQRKSPVTVFATCPTSVMYIDYGKLSFCCEHACSHHVQALRNMLKIVADKYFTLNTRINLLTTKGARERLLHFLSEAAKETGETTFELPMNQTNLAAYLNLDRSAMCRELSALKKEGYIDYHKNKFTVLNSDLLKCAEPY